MSLRGFHIVFITLSVILAFWFALFEYNAFVALKGTADLIAAVISALLGAGMLAYGVWFIQKSRRNA